MTEPQLSPEAWSALISDRRSVRDFRPDPVPDSLLREVIADALRAPSWSNTQPYRLGVASGAVRDRLSAALCAEFDAAAGARRGGAARAWYGIRRMGRPTGDFRVPLVYPPELQARRRATGYGLYSVLGIDREDRPARDEQLRRNFDFFGAPTALFVFVHDGLGAYSVLDAGVMLQTLMLAAHARGLGTCAQGALAIWSGPVRDAFLVPDQYRLLCGVAIGWPSSAPVNAYAPERRTVDDVLLPVRT